MLFYFACEAAGASSARHSLRPLFGGRDLLANLGRIAPRECGSVSQRHCEERPVVSPYLRARQRVVGRGRGWGSVGRHRCCRCVLKHPPPLIPPHRFAGGGKRCEVSLALAMTVALAV